MSAGSKVDNERGRGPEAHSWPTPDGGPEGSAGEVRIGPIVLLLPLLVLLLAATMLLRGAGRDRGTVPPTPQLAAGARVPAWGGTTEIDGGVLEVRLTPVHVDPERQRLDAEALGRRLGLDPGEPWLCVLERRASTRAPALPIAIGSPQVVDEEGHAARVLAPVRTPGAFPETGPSDPLRVLLGLPEGNGAAAPLASGSILRLVLWGRAPGGGARLSFELVDGRSAEIALTARDLPRSAVRGALAQLEPRRR